MILCYCYDISRHWRYWYRHVGIDDEYRGIVGITPPYLLLYELNFNLLTMRSVVPSVISVLKINSILIPNLVNEIEFLF